MEHFSRRNFIKQAIFMATSVLFSGLLGYPLKSFAKEQKPVPLPPGQNPVPDTDAVALAIGYKANIKEIDYVKFPQRKKPEAKNQHCKNCALFVPVNDSWGKCQMLTSGLVSVDGWCGSWSKKS